MRRPADLKAFRELVLLGAAPVALGAVMLAVAAPAVDPALAPAVRATALCLAALPFVVVLVDARRLHHTDASPAASATHPPALTASARNE